MQIKLNGQFNYLFKHFELTFCIFFVFAYFLGVPFMVLETVSL